jgi:hypothetical protein
MPKKDKDEKNKGENAAAETLKAQAAAIDARTEQMTKADEEARKAQKEQAERDFEENEKSLAQRIADAGLVFVMDTVSGKRYAGKSPQTEEGHADRVDAEDVGGRYNTAPLLAISPERGMLVKDPKTSKFYSLPWDLPGNLNASYWEHVKNPDTGETLVPAETDPKLRAARREALGLDEKPKAKAA